MRRCGRAAALLSEALPGGERSLQVTEDAQGHGMDDAAVSKATGRTWDAWFAVLEEHGARSLPHPDIARLLHDEYGVPGWWSQNVTVAYEKSIGRRETGQRCDGDHTTSASRTLPGTLDEVLDRWLAGLAAADGLDGVPFAGEPVVSRTEKWRYWRAKFADGSKAAVNISAKKAGESCVLGIEHDKLAGKPEAERWKTFWKAYLAGL